MEVLPLTGGSGRHRRAAAAAERRWAGRAAGRPRPRRDGPGGRPARRAGPAAGRARRCSRCGPARCCSLSVSVLRRVAHPAGLPAAADHLGGPGAGRRRATSPSSGPTSSGTPPGTTRATGTCCSRCGTPTVASAAGQARMDGPRRGRRREGRHRVPLRLERPQRGRDPRPRPGGGAHRRSGSRSPVLAPGEESEVTADYVTIAGRSVPVPYNGSVARVSFGPRSASRVRRWIREGDFDVLHVHSPVTPSLGMMACWSALGPIVATFHAAIDGRSRLMSSGRLDPAGHAGEGPGADRRQRGGPPHRRRAPRWRRGPRAQRCRRRAVRRCAASGRSGPAPAPSRSSAGSTSRARAWRCCWTRSRRSSTTTRRCGCCVAGPGETDALDDLPTEVRDRVHAAGPGERAGEGRAAVLGRPVRRARTSVGRASGSCCSRRWPRAARCWRATSWRSRTCSTAVGAAPSSAPATRRHWPWRRPACWPTTRRRAELVAAGTRAGQGVRLGAGGAPGRRGLRDGRRPRREGARGRPAGPGHVRRTAAPVASSAGDTRHDRLGVDALVCSSSRCCCWASTCAASRRAWTGCTSRVEVSAADSRRPPGAARGPDPGGGAARLDSIRRVRCCCSTPRRPLSTPSAPDRCASPPRATLSAALRAVFDDEDTVDGAGRGPRRPQPLVELARGDARRRPGETLRQRRRQGGGRRASASHRAGAAPRWARAVAAESRPRRRAARGVGSVRPRLRIAWTT